MHAQLSNAVSSPEPAALSYPTYELHPLCAMFPDLPEDERKELAESIRRDGQQEPGIIHEGRLLDGKNRMAACAIVGTRFRVTPLEAGVDPAKYVLQKNFLRRNLTSSQRAAIGVKIKEWFAAEAEARMKAGRAPDPSANLREGGKASEQAAAVVKASPRTIEAAARVKQQDPVLFEQVASGAVTVNAALGKLTKRAPHVPKRKSSKSKDGLVLVLYNDLDEVRHQAKFYNRNTYPNILYFHLWDQNTFELRRMGWCRYDVLYGVLGAKSKTIKRSRVPVCQSSARFMSLSIHGTIPEPEVVPQQVIEGGLSGVIKVLEQAWPTARRILVSDLKSAPEGWELINESTKEAI